MPNDSLAARVGYLLSAQRNRARLSQRALAERLGVTQQALSKVERGAPGVSLAAVERAFAAIGLQVRAEVEPIGADCDAEIDACRAMSEEDRAWTVERFERIFRRLAHVTFVVAGRLGAFLQGAPVAVRQLDLIVATRDLEAFAEAIMVGPFQRWNPRWEDWGGIDSDPRLPGPSRWRAGLDDLRVTYAEQMPPAIEVRHGERTLRVLPLAEIEASDLLLSRLMARVRARAAGPGGA